MRTQNLLSILIIFNLLFTACKKDVEIKIINVRGIVMNETTNKKVQNVTVTIEQSCGGTLMSGGIWGTTASTSTNTEGSFELIQEVSEGCSYKLNINTYPNYDNELSNYWTNLKSDDNIDRIFYLYSKATLYINTFTNQPLTSNDTLWFSIPGIGCRSTTVKPCNNLSTNSAKANTKNLVSWTVSRNGIKENYQDSVYCLLDITTYYTINH